MGGRLGLWKGICWDRVLKKDCGWLNMVEFLLGGNWVCARVGQGGFLENFRDGS